MSTRSAGQGFGQPVLRREDARLLVVQGCSSDDFNAPAQASGAGAPRQRR